VRWSRCPSVVWVLMSIYGCMCEPVVWLAAIGLAGLRMQGSQDAAASERRTLPVSGLISGI
jgi:hypothetical protein